MSASVPDPVEPAEDEDPAAFDRFADLAKKLATVPKREVDEKRRK